MVGILVSFWEGPFSGAMLVLGRVIFLELFPSASKSRKSKTSRLAIGDKRSRTHFGLPSYLFFEFWPQGGPLQSF